MVVDDVILGMFLYYFFGLVLSRIGSILIEPVLRCTKIVQFSDYARFVRASKLDDKIELLSEVNNMHRTIIAMLVVLLVISVCNRSATCSLTAGLLGIVILFILSYRKQTSFVVKRIDEMLPNVQQ